MMTQLLTLILFAQGIQLPPPPPATLAPLRLKEAVQDFPRSQLQPKVSGPISIDLSQSSRASYEALAQLAGFEILFDPDFRNASFAPFKVENAAILEAFDRLSITTGNYVEVLDNRTILVAPNNVTKRQKYEPQILKTFFLTKAQELAVATVLRTTLQMRQIATITDGKALIIKDNPDRLAAAEKIIAMMDSPNSSQPVAVDAVGNILSPDRISIRKTAPARSRLQARGGPVSINLNGDARTSYETLAEKAGLNVIFDPDFRGPGSLSLKLDNADVLDALDFLALQTSTFWQPLDGTTILVSPDNQARRRDYEQMVLKTLYLGNISDGKLITEIITALRTLLNARYLMTMSGANGIVILDTPSRVALAEKIVADLGKTATTGLTLDVGNETGGVPRSRAVRSLGAAPSQLKVPVTGKLSIDMNENARQAFERLAGMAGLRVTFDSRFQDGAVQHLALKDASVIDALDFLSLQTRNIWEVFDSATILVAPDSLTVRRDLEPHTEKVIGLTNAQTQVAIVEIVTALRTLLNIRQVEGADKAIALRDTLDNVVIAEKIAVDIDKHLRLVP